MTMQVWPTQTSNITLGIRTIITQQKYSVFENVHVLVLDPKVVILFCEIVLGEVLKSP